MNMFTIQTTSESEGAKCVTTARAHQIITDEPKNMGGADTGANPLETYFAALAGCEAVVAGMVAKEMDFQLDGMAFAIEGDLDVRGFMGDPAVSVPLQSIRMKVRVKTDEPDSRLQELKARVEHRCPVYAMTEAAGVAMEADWRADGA